MSMLNEVKTNGHAEPVTRAWDDRFAGIERRIAEVADSTEQRVVVLRDAIAEFFDAELAPRDEKIAILEKRVTDLEQKLERQTAVDQQVAEIATRLEERQALRDRGKNGITDGDLTQTIARERESARNEFKAADAEMQRAHEAKLAALEHCIVQHADQRFNQHIEQCSGRTHALRDVIATERADRRTEVKVAVEEAQGAFETKLTALEQRLKSVPGKLPVAKIWQPETVVYQSEFVSHEGALWQAKKDTATCPGTDDWVCVARAGRDATSPDVRGTFTTTAAYKKLDVVVSGGAAFIAKNNQPGICPGDGWQLLSRQGRPGRPGPAGPRGERGLPGTMPQLVSSEIDENYNLVLLRSDGTDKILEIIPLRPAFERFLSEVSEVGE